MVSLDYTTFIEFVRNASLQILYIEDSKTYLLYGIGSSFVIHATVIKDGTDDQISFETDWKSLSNRPIAPNITTQFEKNDKDLKLASSTAIVDPITGQAVINFKVPGVYEDGDGRWIAGGTAFFDTADAGDRVKSVLVVDIDNILGYGENFLIKSYTDLEELPDVHWGWYIPVKKGQVEVEPIGGYGFIPAGLYIQIIGEKAAINKLGTFYMNIFWGKTG